MTRPRRDERDGRDGAWDALARLVIRRPGPVILLVGLATALAGTAAGLFLRIQPGYVELLDPDAPGQARYLALLEEFGNVESLHVLVDSSEPGAAGAFVDRFLEELARDATEPPAVADALGRVNLSWFVDRAPAWLSGDLVAALTDLESLPSAAADPRPALVLQVVDDLVARQAAEGTSGGPEDAAALERLLELLAAAARGEEPDPLADLGRLASTEGGAGSLDEAGHVVLPDGRLLVTIAPADVRNDFAEMTRFLAAVEGAAERARARSPAPVELAFTGAPVLLVDEMRTSQRDVLRSTLVALALVSVLFLASFHSVRHVAFAVAALLCGLGLTFGAALALVGSLNLFSVVFAAVLVGLGIDFGVHVINKYEALLREGVPGVEAVRRLLPSVGPPTAVGAVTTSVAFFSTVASDFRGFSQLGLIAGTGVLICLATAVTLLPALLVRSASRETARAIQRTAHPWTRRLLHQPLHRAGPVLALSVALVLFGAVGAGGLRFDHDILNLQPAGTEAVALAKGRDGRAVSTHFAHSVAGSIAEARGLEESFRRLPSVRSVRSVASFLPEPSSATPAELEALAARVARPTTGEPARAVDEAEVEETLAAVGRLESRLLDLQDLAFEADDRSAFAALDRLMERVDELRAALGRDTAAAGLEQLRARLRPALARMTATLPSLAREPLAPDDLPAALRERFVGETGRLAVVIEPRHPIWDREALEAFVAALRRVDPDVTGPPVQVLEVTATMWRSLQVASVTALLAITLIVALALRSLLGVVLALAPLLSGFVVMLGVLSWIDVPLNPANLVALPLILGIGVDHAVHLAHRWLVDRDVTAAIDGVGHAIVVTSLTTIAGFSGLLVAAHRGVRSLGVVACIGTCAMLFASLVLLPTALRVFETRQAARRADDPPRSTPGDA